MAEHERQRILIIDDEPAVRMALEMALADTPHHVQSVETAEKALALLAAQTFDLLIVDKNLPGISGVELLRRVRQHRADVWAAMITGYPSAESAMEMLHLGIRGYLEKPFDDIFEVVRRVESILGAKRAQDRLDEALLQMQQAADLFPATRALKIVVIPANETEGKWLLARTGYPVDIVLSAQTGAAALSLLSGQAADLVVCDAGMREPDLFAFIRALRASSPSAQWVVISDAPSLRMLTELIDARVAEVICRPLAESSYRGRVEALLMRLRTASAAKRTMAAS
jgi:DNA-binding response OmpR family regulator